VDKLNANAKAAFNSTQQASDLFNIFVEDLRTDRVYKVPRFLAVFCREFVSAFGQR
jgi:hypothetical protein